jgi:hypothetical protein
VVSGLAAGALHLSEFSRTLKEEVALEFQSAIQAASSKGQLRMSRLFAGNAVGLVRSD